MIENAALAVSNGRIAFAGPMSELPDAARAPEQVDLGGRLVTPGLIDCHTHIVFGGERSEEFELRLAGADYANIARAGGGILSTVRATSRRDGRDADDHSRRTAAGIDGRG
ncbi:Amidohydrolase 1 domain protein, partial [mine drainage metagenome]